MKLHHKLYMCIALVLLSLSVFRPALAAENEFAIGPMLGRTNFKAELPEFATPKEDDDGVNYGLLMRYTRKNDNGVFAGVQLGITIEDAKYADTVTESINVEGNFVGERYRISSDAETSQTSNPRWNADFLLRFGRDFGAFSLYGAVGASLLSMEATVSASREEAVVALLSSTPPPLRKLARLI